MLQFHSSGTVEEVAPIVELIEMRVETGMKCYILYEIENRLL